MQNNLKYIICLISITFSAHTMQWVNGLFKKKSPEEIASDAQQEKYNGAKKDLVHALSGLGVVSPEKEKTLILQMDDAVDRLESALPGTKFEFMFIIQNNNNHQTNTTNVGPIDESALKNYRNLFTKGQTHINQGFQSLTEYLAHHKKRIFCFACIGIYATIQLALFSIKQNLRTMQCWSLSNLNTRSFSFSQTLLNEIQHTYCNISNPADFVTPLICFIEDIEHEKYYLQKYEQLIGWLEDCYLHKIFLYDTKLYKSAPERIQKLSAMKQSFMAWLSDFKTQHVQINQPQNLLQTMTDNI